MRVLCVLLVALCLSGGVSGLFIGGIIEGIFEGIGNIFDFGVTTINKLVDTGVNLGGAVIGTVIDPFGWFKGSVDDHGHATGNVTKCPAIADIYFLLDTSSSMTRDQFDLQKVFVYRVAEHFWHSKGDVQFALATFSDSVSKIFGFGQALSLSAIKQFLDATPYRGGSTRTYDALSFIRTRQEFSPAKGARLISTKIVVTVTDGNSDSFFTTNSEANALKDLGYKVVCVGIGSGLGIELRNIASGSENVFAADNFDGLVKVEQRVARQLCQIPQSEGNIPAKPGAGGTSACPKGYEPNPNDRSKCVDINECKSTDNPCQQNCINLVGAFRCTCKAGYQIDTTDTTKCKQIKVCTNKVDVFVAIDCSGSIGTDNFKLQQTFVAKLLHHYTYGPKGGLFGALLFCSNVTLLFNLNTYATRTEATSSLLSAPYFEGATFTGSALNYIVTNRVYSPENGGRYDAKKVLIIVTDGQSSDPQDTAVQSERVKSIVNRVITVGIGDQVNPKELALMASSSNDTILVSEFSLLDYSEERVATRAC